MRKLYKNFVFDLIIAISALLLGIIMLPPFGIGGYALHVLLAATIIVYFIVYLWDKLVRTKGTVFLLTVLECTVYVFIVIDLILGQFGVSDVVSVCRALGVFLWTRGVVSAMGMYINLSSSKTKRSNLPGFLVRISLISFGMFLFAHPLLNDVFLNWAMCIIFFLSTLGFGGLAILFAPTSDEKSKNAEQIKEKL